MWWLVECLATYMGVDRLLRLHDDVKRTGVEYVELVGLWCKVWWCCVSLLCTVP